MKQEECRKQNRSTLSRVLGYFRALPSSGCILLVRLYRVTLSPAKTFLVGPAGQCRFEPSCSQYAIEALQTHGAVTGGWLAAKRVCRCHPWGECGEDPVPTKSKGQSPRSKVQMLKAKVQGPRAKVQTLKSKVQGLKSKVQRPKAEGHSPKAEGLSQVLHSGVRI